MSGNTWIIIGVIAGAFSFFAVPYGFFLKSKEQSYNIASLPPQAQRIVLAARIEAQKADVAAAAAKDAEVAGKIAAEKARQGEPLMKVIDEPGRHYEGEWSGGAPSGFGRVIWGGQSASIGESFTGKLEGWKRVRGVFEYPNPRQNPANSSDVRRYEGDWQPTPRNESGDWQGNGVLIFRDGSIFRGQVNDGKKDGFGQLIKPDGLRVEGLWRNDQEVVDESVR